ncbi:MAG: hypothetical protein KKH28_15360 [Elusimicrobia bacterium]|nr:hypothetical protein [Elusimicrobiota bacterium]
MSTKILKALNRIGFSAVNPARFMALLAASLFFSITPVYAQNTDGNPLKDDHCVFDQYEIQTAPKYPEYFTINPDSIKITIQEVTEEKDMSYLGPERADTGDTLVIIDQIVNIASKIWQIIKQNAPVSHINVKYASAVPEGITAWNQLAEWKKPKTYVYGFYAENIYGLTMVNVKYKVIYSYGGKYKGKGYYLTGVTVTPSVVNVGWGCRFSLGASVPDSTITNIGTATNPVAALQLKMTWKISTVTKDTTGTSVYYIQGDGYFEEIASPFTAKAAPRLEEFSSAQPLLRASEIVFD